MATETRPETIHEHNLRESFRTLKDTVSERLGGHDPIDFWHNENAPIENPDLAPEELRTETLEIFKELAMQRLQETRDLIEHICREGSADYTAPESGDFTAENLMNDEEQELIAQHAWNHHVEKLEEQERRLPQEVVAIIQDSLLSQGVIPQGTRLARFSLVITPPRHQERGDKSISAGVRDATYVFTDEKYPHTAELRPDYLGCEFWYGLRWEKGEYQKDSYDELIPEGHIDTRRYITRRLALQKERPGEEVYQELDRMEEIASSIQTEIDRRREAQEIGEHDHKLVDAATQMVDTYADRISAKE